MSSVKIGAVDDAVATINQQTLPLSAGID